MIEKLIKIIKESNNIVVFTGAGASTDSGLKVTTKNENDDSQKFKLIAIDFNDKEE